MTTWNTITISKPGNIAVEGEGWRASIVLHTDDDVLSWGTYGDTDDERVTIPERKALYDDYIYPERPGNPDGDITSEGESKYRDDDFLAWALAVTAIQPETVISWRESWDDDDGGKRFTVIQGGKEQNQQGAYSEMVPNGLQHLIADVRECIAELNVALEGDSGDAELDAAIELREASARLVDALDAAQGF